MATKPFYIHQKPPAQSFIRLPNFLFEAPSLLLFVKRSQTVVCDDPASNGLIPQKQMCRRVCQDHLYYPINEVCELLHCGRQKAVDMLRELQYADLISIKKQGVENPTVSIQNTMKRVRTPTSRNPVAERRETEK